MKNYFGNDKEFYFVYPLDGDCMNVYDGAEKDGALNITARVAAPAGKKIMINENEAVYRDGFYECEASLTGYRNTLFADNLTDGTQTKIVVFRIASCIGKYRLSSDDNILFLADITENKDVYKSVFENPYLAVYKKAHDLYGAKVHLNLFYEFDANAAKSFSTERKYFNLSMMTDKFKSEFIKNSDWLKLSFHARSEMPDKPYENTTFERISEDIKLVHKEIVRFAGKETLSNICTLHWGASNIVGVRALRQAGYKGLTGYFEVLPNGNPLVAYYYPADFVRHVGDRDFWFDTDEDVMYGRIDKVLNTIKLEQVVPALEEIYSNPHRAGFMSVMIHEQYFLSDYRRYIPEFEQIVLTACRWLSVHGYRGALMSETMFN
ncbi:MAG: hypothetical protein VB118_08270 [Oscillospiraceae bacterium]|nr:hypothetical protein [Oscillospiraceae bacterium]